MTKQLDLGMMIGYWGAGPPVGTPELIAEAGRLGFRSIWTAEAYGSDALTPLAWWGAQTSRIQLGTSIIQMSARTPTATAMAAITMDHLSNGRFILGLGASGPQVVEGWYGQSYAKPLARTREYVEIIRSILAREKPVTYAGEHYTLPYPAGTDSGRRCVPSPTRCGRTCRSTSRPRGRRTSRSPPRSPTAGCRSTSRRASTASTGTRWRRASAGPVPGGASRTSPSPRWCR